MSANQSVLGKLVLREIRLNVSELIGHFMSNPGSLEGSDYNDDDLLELAETYDYEEAGRDYLDGQDLQVEDWQQFCRENDVDLENFRLEALEYWVVSRWFAEKLKEKGEIVGELFGLNVWGRTTSGQAILLDSVIEEIGRDMEILEGQASHKYWID